MDEDTNASPPVRFNIAIAVGLLMCPFIVAMGILADRLAV